MRWSVLAAALGLPSAPEAVREAEVTAITYDSRHVGEGAVFVAIPGAHQDGHQFVETALARGAVIAVVGHQPAGGDLDRLVVVGDVRAALAKLAATFYGRPSDSVPVVGVTGTDGKTTTTTMLQAALAATLGTVGSLSTVDFRIGEVIEPNLSWHTTLEAVEVQAMLRRMVDQGCQAVVLESTSHGLALQRVGEVRFAGAVYTSITRDHLDFHSTWEAYFEAKASLLERTVSTGGFAVLNLDDHRAYPSLLKRAGRRRMSYSANGVESAELWASQVMPEPAALVFTAHTPAGDARVRLATEGRWNVANALAAVGAGLLLDQPLPELVEGLGRFRPVAGRMERVELGQAFTVIVDYAHTPAALNLVLHDLRSMTPGRLWVVFGTPGERDVTNRPEMGRIASQVADQVVVSTDDSRSEDPELIIDQIWAGAVEAGGVPEETLHRRADRDQAIRLAVSSAVPGDTVLLAGMGHEASMFGADGPRPWSDRAAAEEAIRDRLG
jgi:UDP-N-acetylmuramoyl-L-alanyl-D-glutamate--2,6-diaminopimelate ligase